MRTAHAQTLAAVIRRVRPGIVLAPTTVENQHPDHARLGRLTRDAARLARYGGIADLRNLPAHTISALLYYAVTSDGEPPDSLPILVDVSAPGTLDAWRRSMDAHGSQAATRPYAEMQLARARAWGLRAGTDYAQPLYPNDSLVLRSLATIQRSARAY
jgi:LmbE family N-acetylglucosaminyl deacetylase